MIRTNWLVGVALCTFMAAGNVSAGSIGTVDLSLNLEFDTPFDINSGGTWTAVAKADQGGLAGIAFLIDGSNNDAAIFGEASAAFDFFATQQVLTVIEVVEGSDLVAPVFDLGVIGGTFPTTYVDPAGIAPLPGKADLGSFTGGARLSIGTFDPGTVPDLIASFGALSQGANVFESDLSGAVLVASLNTTVRAIVPEPASIAVISLGL